jgi:hypothetical protein
MTGEAHWMTLAWLGATALGVLVIFFFMFRLDRRFRSIFRRWRCPVSETVVSGTMVQDTRTGEWTGVQSCSAFTPDTAICCERRCVANSNRPERVHETPAPAPSPSH